MNIIYCQNKIGFTINSISFDLSSKSKSIRYSFNFVESKELDTIWLANEFGIVIRLFISFWQSLTFVIVILGLE